MFGAMLVAVLAVGGCRPDVAPAEASEFASPLPLVDRLAVDERPAEPTEQNGGQAVVTTVDEDAFGPFGLLAPMVPGLVLGNYASSCDPFEESLGSCL